MMTVTARITRDTYLDTIPEWGGATIDLETGYTLPKGINCYAVATKPKGISTLSIPANVSVDVFTMAFNLAVAEFTGIAPYLGIFHDAGTHTIQFDPVTVVATREEVDELSNTYPITGGAFNFATGEAYWPERANTNA
jgi:hypothetical protein